jgi:hypothetical protein
MSDRKLADTDYAAKLKASHLAQIDALTRGGLSDNSRVRAFARASDFPVQAMHNVEYMLLKGYSAATALWTYGQYPLSLFANLPGCQCPVIEGLLKVPEILAEDGWRPSVAVLQEFARIQQEARLDQPRTA